MPDTPMTDPLLDDTTKALYMGLDPTTRQPRWSDDPAVGDARDRVRMFYESRFDHTVDIVERKREAALRQVLERSFDADSQQNPDEFLARHGYLRKTLDQFISEPVAPQQQGLQALALELDEILKNPAYMDTSHHAHSWYVQKASELYRAIYNSGPDGGRRG